MRNATAECQECGRRFDTSSASVGVALALGMDVVCDRCRDGA